MLSTVVTTSLNAAQLFALIAVILFAICTVWALTAKTFYQALLAAGLTFAALCLLFGI